jgi:hypothetical protein
MKGNWQQHDWPHFTWNQVRLSLAEESFSLERCPPGHRKAVKYSVNVIPSTSLTGRAFGQRQNGNPDPAVRGSGGPATQRGPGPAGTGVRAVSHRLSGVSKTKGRIAVLPAASCLPVRPQRQLPASSTKYPTPTRCPQLAASRWKHSERGFPRCRIRFVKGLRLSPHSLSSQIRCSP